MNGETIVVTSVLRATFYGAEDRHTAIWKEPVKGGASVRRPQYRGDGQGDFGARRAEHGRFCLSDRVVRYWKDRLGRRDFTYATSSGRTLPLRAWLTTRFQLATDNGRGALFEVPSRVSPVIAWVSGMKEPQLESSAYLERPNRDFTFECCRKAGRGGRRDCEGYADGPERMT